MTIKFALESAALWPSPSTGQATEKANNIRFLDFWRRYGVFFMNSNTQPINDALEVMPQPIRKLWQAALLSEGFRKVDYYNENNEDFFNTPEILLNNFHDVDIACVEADTASKYLPKDEYCGFFENKKPEICRFDCVDSSNQVIKFRNLWDQIIPSGTSRDNIWKDRFHGLTFFAKRIAIIDRYCGKSISQCYTEGRLSGTTFFLKLLSQIPGDIKNKSISIYTSDKDVDISDIQASLEKQLKVNKKNIASVRLYIAQDREFSKISHDRFLRFDNIVTSIGKGISLFEHASCKENFSCAIQNDDGSFKAHIESFLQNVSSSYSIK